MSVRVRRVISHASLFLGKLFGRQGYFVFVVMPDVLGSAATELTDVGSALRQAHRGSWRCLNGGGATVNGSVTPGGTNGGNGQSTGDGASGGNGGGGGGGAIGINPGGSGPHATGED